jgi:hypothetical protein
MATVTVPPGCTGLDLADGTRYQADSHGRVQVSDEHAGAIGRSWYAQTGLMRPDEPHILGTKATQVCTACVPSRRWNAWSTTCPRCGATTTPERQSQP